VAERVLVMGVGNPLMRDEGVGNAVVDLLQRYYRAPENLRFVDAGTMGMSILNLFRDVDYLLVIDAVQGTGEPPGTVVLMSPDDIAPNQVLHSLHDMRLVDVLQAAELLEMRPAADFVGVEVAEIVHMQPGLTTAVEAAVPRAAEAVVDLLARRGLALEPVEG